MSEARPVSNRDPSSGATPRAGVAPFPDSDAAAFRLVDGALWCEDVPVEALAARFGTPLYVYSSATMRERFASVRAAFGAATHVCFAVKSNPNLSVLRLFGQLGAGFDVVSAGELARVAAAGQPTDGVVFAGVAKTAADASAGVERDVLFFNVESPHEVGLLEAAAARRGRRARVAIRLNPDVAADTHAYIATGREGDKFGLSLARAAELVATVRASRWLELVGYHFHLGSQLRDPDVWSRALDRVEDFLDGAAERRDGIRYLDVGGGFGIRYGGDAPALDVAAVAARVLPRLAARGLRPVVEPGRFLVGDAGVLLTRVLGEKAGASRRFVLVDAAMNDLLRPALYGARHPIHAVRDPAPGPDCDVVGPVCESGDFLGRGVPLRPTVAGELLAVLAAGAYGASMASTYNSRPRPAEVLVDGEAFWLVRRRERLEDLWAGELDPAAGRDGG